VEGGDPHPVSDRAEQRLGERTLVPGTVVAAPVDEERRGDAGAALEPAPGVLTDARGRGGRDIGIARRGGGNAQLGGDARELALRGDRRTAHERVVRVPEARR